MKRLVLFLPLVVGACATSGVQRRATAIANADRDAKRAIAMENEIDPGRIPPRTLSVLPFTVTTSDTALRPLGFAMSDFLLTDLGQSPQIQLVERQHMGAILREIRLVDEGVVDPRGAPRVGRLLGARRLIIGNVTAAPGGDLVVSARVVDAIGGTVQQLVTATAPLPRFIDALKELSLRLFEELGITLTPAQRARIERRQTENLAAALAYGRGVNADVRGDAAAAVAAFEEAARIDVAFASARSQVSGPSPASSSARGSSSGVARVLDLSAQAVNPVATVRVADVAEAAVQSNQLLTLLLTIRVF